MCGREGTFDFAQEEERPCGVCRELTPGVQLSAARYGATANSAPITSNPSSIIKTRIDLMIRIGSIRFAYPHSFQLGNF